MSREKALQLMHPTGILRGEVRLPASKSESNRALLIKALSPETITLHNLSEANDTILLQRLLCSPETELNAEDAGTVMRFLTAFYSLTGKNKIITGTARMQQRPIGILVNALQQLGAEISYLGQPGFPPLKIQGFKPAFTGPAKISMQGDVSSQFISAILLCAPVFPHGLHLELTGKIASRPYLKMTLSLMNQFGLQSEFSGNQISVKPGNYQGGEFTVEADWSAASYWYSLVALAKEADILLIGLKENSLQGDKKVAELMEAFGVKTEFEPDGIRLIKTNVVKPEQAIDFSDIPDLAQTFAVLAAAKNVALELTGLESLRLKETDRIKALQTELAKFGATLKEIKPGTFMVGNDSNLAPKTTVEPALQSKKIGRGISPKTAIATYHDHRMAMAFAPLAVMQEITIEDPDVVRKSYPGFWEELRKVGFELKSIRS